jgi:hypothetical protein
MAQNFDLFGDLIPDNWGKRGRPQHVRTVENINKVTLLVALGWGNERVANSLNVTLPTFRKHYFSLVKSLRDTARDRLDATYAAELWKQVRDGNVGAMRLWADFLQRNDRMGTERALTAETEQQAPPAAVGKKAQDAQRAADADSDLMAELDNEAAANAGPSRH